jgi:Ca2+-binding EF-hand superfamily protein
MNVKLLPCSILAAYLSLPAWADGGSSLSEQSKMTQTLLRYDTNKDGIVTRTETVSSRLAEFTKADTNTDGFLSWDEFKALSDSKRQDRLSSILKVMDSNANGSVSPEEFIAASVDLSAAQAAELFALLDTDVSNTLIRAELQVLVDGDEPTGMLMRQFAVLDTNTDGKLTAAEYTTKPASIPAPPKVRPVPAYTSVSVTDSNVVAAANFAASKLGTASVKLIMKAEAQTATGTNYRLALTLSDGKSYIVIVNQAADGTLQLKEYSTLTAVVGSYTSRSVTDADVVAAAKFAASKLGTATLQTVLKAESQVVAGTNYRLSITLSDGKSYIAIVFQALDGTLQLKESALIK